MKSKRDADRGRGALLPSLTLSLTIILMWGGVPAARASIWTGTCPVEVSFSFNSKVRAPSSLSHPSYSVGISSLLGLPCAVSLSPLELGRTTSGGGSGSSVSWTCQETLASGSWSQNWSPSLPAVSAGTHAIAGTWGEWTMVVASGSLNYIGVIELTVSPFDAVSLVTCETSGITSLSMVGTMVFQDPEMPTFPSGLSPELLRLWHPGGFGSPAAACPGLPAVPGAGEPLLAKAGQDRLPDCRHHLGPGGK